MSNININSQYYLNTDACPVIPRGSTVIVEHIRSFPSDNKVFVTLRDVHVTNKDRFGKDEPIISTILLSEDTLLEDAPNLTSPSYLVLVKRYLLLLQAVRPDINAKKNPKGSLDLSHIKWMLEKMNDPSYTPLTTHSAWITWIQSSLYQHGLIVIQDEKILSREILRQHKHWV